MIEHVNIEHKQKFTKPYCNFHVQLTLVSRRLDELRNTLETLSFLSLHTKQCLGVITENKQI